MCSTEEEAWKSSKEDCHGLAYWQDHPGASTNGGYTVTGWECLNLKQGKPNQDEWYQLAGKRVKKDIEKRKI
jgi:hypothetical protein